MATIAVCAWPLPGMINGVLSFACRLRARGHTVHIISIADAEPAVSAAGLPFEPVLTEAFPAGFLIDLRKKLASLSLFARLRETRKWIRRYEELIDAVISGDNREVDEVFARISPSLVLSSLGVRHLSVVTFLAARRGIPFAYITTQFNHYVHAGNPPQSSTHVPRPGLLGEWLVRLLWLGHDLARAWRNVTVVALGLDMDVLRQLRPLAKEQGKRAIEWRSFLAPLARVPEFLLTADELDFPVPLPERSHRIGFSATAWRVKTAFPWERVDPARKLLFCSLGTLLFLPLERQRAVLQAAIDAAATRPQWQLVMATGAYVRPEELHPRAPGEIVLQQVPQMDVLARAKLMITHAGSNSLHECVASGVPMVLFPIAFDQPGNAARAVYHGLGLMGDVRKADAVRIGQLIDEVSKPQFARKSAEMARRLRNPPYAEAGLRALEALAEEGRPCAA
jgi:zeaxanthin glucosyltransferase